MLHIYVGDAQRDQEVTVDTATRWNNLLPLKVVQEFRTFLNEEMGETASIRVYNGTLLNYIGELIEDGNLNFKEVLVYTEFGTHRYDEAGCLDHTWPYGIFRC